MFKRHHQLFTALRVVIDMLLVAAAFWGAYSLRFGSPLIGSDANDEVRP